MTNTNTTDPTTDGPTVPDGITLRTDITAADVIGTRHPSWIDPADMVVVSGAWGTNATTDITDPTRGVGRGYVRPFITDGMAEPFAGAVRLTDGAWAGTCAKCRRFMGITAFPTRSKPTKDGSTHRDTCRTCRDNKPATDKHVIDVADPRIPAPMGTKAPKATRAPKAPKVDTTA